MKLIVVPDTGADIMQPMRKSLINKTTLEQKRADNQESSIG